MSRLPTPGADTNTWGDILNDFLTQAHNPDGTLKDNGILATKADDSLVIHNSGDESIDGVKTFSSSPVIPTPSSGSDAANKTYVDAAVSAGVSDATTTSKGIVQLAGDLSGTASAPTVPGLATKADDNNAVHLAGTETITGDKDFTGGLTHNGSAVVATTDVRLSDQRVPTDGSVTLAKFAQDMATQVELDAEITARSNADALLVPKSIVDAKGDLIVATAADTVARRPVGANGQVLTADSAEADGVRWATPSTGSNTTAIFDETFSNFSAYTQNSGTFTVSSGRLENAAASTDTQATRTGVILPSNHRHVISFQRLAGTVLDIGLLSRQIDASNALLFAITCGSLGTAVNLTIYRKDAGVYSAIIGPTAFASVTITQLTDYWLQASLREGRLTFDLLSDDPANLTASAPQLAQLSVDLPSGTVASKFGYVRGMCGIRMFNPGYADNHRAYPL